MYNIYSKQEQFKKHSLSFSKDSDLETKDKGWKIMTTSRNIIGSGHFSALIRCILQMEEPRSAGCKRLLHIEY